MRRVFLDTNVALDLIADRGPFADDADEIFNAGREGTIELAMCSLSFTNIYYLTKKLNGSAAAMAAIKDLKPLVAVLAVDTKCIERSIVSDFDDFEDAVQYHSALEGDVDLIITRDEKGFKRSRLPVMTPKAFLRTL